MFDDIALHSNSDIPYQQIQYNNVQITIKRLDLVHPHISGNKFYKLKYNFQEAQRLGHRQVLTFGGAYSNHIAATAYAAHHSGFASIGIIRGEELRHKPLNSTLATAQRYGMQLYYVSREKYKLKNSPEFLAELNAQFAAYYLIPEGGTNALAIQGCKDILSSDDQAHYDLVCCAVGTGGTIAGLIETSAEQQHVLGFSALKGDFLTHDVEQLTARKNWRITDAYCCGGYAKTSTELLNFIHHFEKSYAIPLEHIYTGKMLMGIFDMIDQAQIAKHQRILVIHTGGLQGRLKDADHSVMSST